MMKLKIDQHYKQSKLASSKSHLIILILLGLLSNVNGEDTTCDAGYYLKNGKICTPCSPGNFENFNNELNRILLPRWNKDVYEQMLTRFLYWLWFLRMFKMPKWI